MSKIAEPEVVYCEHNHIYDRSLSAECPYCKQIAERTSQFKTQIDATSRKGSKKRGFGRQSWDSDDDATTLLSRGWAALTGRSTAARKQDDDETTALLRYNDEDDATVLRRPGDEDDDATVLRRPGDEDDDATVLRRPGDEDDDATVLRRPGDDNDATVLRRDYTGAAQQNTYTGVQPQNKDVLRLSLNTSGQEDSHLRSSALVIRIGSDTDTTPAEPEIPFVMADPVLPDEEIPAAVEEILPVVEEIPVEPEPVVDYVYRVPVSAEEIVPVVEEIPAAAEEIVPVAEEIPAAAEEIVPVAEEISAAAEEIVPVAEEIPVVAEEIVPVAEEIPAAAEDIVPAEEVPVAEEEPPVVAEPVKVRGKVIGWLVCTSRGCDYGCSMELQEGNNYICFDPSGHMEVVHDDSGEASADAVIYRDQVTGIFRIRPIQATVCVNDRTPMGSTYLEPYSSIVFSAAGAVFFPAVGVCGFEWRQ